MKKTTLMFFMALLWFTGYAQLPMEGFEGSWPPTGWTVNNVTGPAQTWVQANGGGQQPAYEGLHAAYLNKENVASGTFAEDWLITPVVNIPNNAQIHFFSSLTQAGNQGSVYKVYIGTDPTDLGTFTELQSWTELEINAVQDEYEEKIVNIPASYSGQNYAVAFVMLNDDGDRWLIDNVSVVQQCNVPTGLTASNITTTGASLNWTDAAQSGSWEIQVLPATSNPGTTGTVYSGTLPYAATNLLPSTSYVFYVRSLCTPAGNNSAWAGPFAFSTVQEPTALDWSTDFESATNGFTIINGSQTNKWTIGSATYNSPTHALYVSNDNGVSNTYTNSSASVVHAYRDVIIPEGATEVNLTFDWKNVGENNYDYIRVWNVPTSFTPAAGTQTTATADRLQIGGNFVGANQWTTSSNTFNVSAYAGTTRRFIFEWRNDGVSGSNPPGAIDNVGFTLVTCPQPNALTVTNLTQNSATLGWTNVGTATSWEIYAVPANDPAPTASTTGVVTSNNPYTLSDLTPGTNYKFYVRAICGPDDKSFWSGPFGFSTTQVPATLNYANNLETENGFTFVNGTQTNQWYYGTAVSSSPTHSLYVTNDNGVNNSYTNSALSVVHAYRDIAVPTGTSDVNLSFDWRNLGETNYDYIRAWIVPVSYVPEAGVQTTAAADRIQVGGNFVGNATWSNFAQIFNAAGYAGGTMRLVFEWRNDGFGGSNPAGAVDNINLTIITCPQPTAVTVTNIGDTSATVNWTEPGTAESWEIYVVPANDPAPTASSTGVVVTDNPHTLTDLDEATLYDVYVRSICGPTESSFWTGPIEFNTTICPVEEQCTYTFTLTDSYGDGWNGNTMTVTQNGITIGTLALPSGSGPLTVSMPACHGLPINLFWNAGGSFATEVGVTVQNGFGQQVYAHAPGSNLQNSLLYSGTVDCDNPECLPPTGLEVSDITMTEATLSWAGEETGNWEYIILPEGSPVPGDDADWVATTTNPVTADGLTAATNYDYYVRMVCSETEASEPEGPVSFHTDVCEEETQCNYTFEITHSLGYGASGNTFTISQGGVEIATIGSDFTWGYSMSYTVPLCPDVEIEIMMNNTGWTTANIGLNVYTPFLEDLYNMAPGSGVLDSVVFTGTPSCDPPPCPRPQNLEASDVTLTSASLSWDEMGDATQWEIIILPYGSDEPTAETTGVVTSEIPYVAEDLIPGTPYEFYVRALCGGEDGNSNWAGPQSFITLIANDDCAGAVEAPVNTGAECVENVTGTMSGATGSGMQPSCQEWSTSVADVWYQFTATNATHAVTIDNTTGGIYPYFVVYSGECGELEEVYCSDYNSQGSVSGLVPGQTYYVMAYLTYFGDPTIPTSFDLCITTPSVISVDNNVYTVPELVSDVLVNSLCATVSNVTWSTGGDSNNLTTGIAHFGQGNSNFEIQEGVVLVSGDAMKAPGPNLGTQSDGYWDGDQDLFDYIQESGIDPGLYDYNDATVLEFDFVPLSSHIKFPFIFASEEYGTFQCSYSDAFAFFLTDADGVTTNLAVLPGTSTPVSVVTIRDGEYNSGCESANEEYFDSYYAAGGEDPASAPINFNGVTHMMYAESDVVVGQTYHIKLVVADRNDNSMDSAVFIGPFDIGDVDLGADLTVDANTALCSGGSATIDAGLDPDEYSFTWYLGDDEIEGETGPTITVTEEGTYTVVAHYFSSTCETSDSILVEFYDPVDVVVNDPQDLTECNTSGYDEFDLSANTTVILNGVENADDYEITYHASAEDAASGENDLALTYTNTVQTQQTIYVRAFNTETGCYGVKEFNLIVQAIPPQFTVSEDLALCEGTSGTITVTPGNYEPSEVTYTWTQDGTPLAATTAEITVTTSGEYEVTVDKSGCTGTATVTVVVTPIPVPDAQTDVTVCDSYVLPVLDAENHYFTATNGGGTELFAGDVINDTQTIYVYAESAANTNCTAEAPFVVTIVTTPDVTAPEDQMVCDGYVLPELTVGNYYTEANGAGTQIAAGTEITATQTIYVYAINSALCFDEDSFTVTVVPYPLVDDKEDVTVCDTYELPALTNGNYYTGTNGTGEQLAAGTELTSSQTVYIFATNGTCTSETSFTVNLIALPLLAVDAPIAEECDQMNFVLTAVFAEEEDIYNPDNVVYSWTNEATGQVVGTEQAVVITDPGTYTVTVTPNGTECSVSATLEVDDTGCTVQRGISPGGSDGLNDTFDLSNLDVKKLSIFNRYGQEVYKFNGTYTNQWGGQTSGGDELPTGTYFYSFERSNGESKTGWIYINRGN